MSKKLFLITLVTLIIFSVAFVFSCGENKEEEDPTPAPPPEEEVIDDSSKIVLAYVTAWSTIIPDPDYVTHINYSFGYVNETFNGIVINNNDFPKSEDRLISIVNLKRNKPSLNVILSIGGGTGSAGFSAMARSESNRKSFAADCKRVIDRFNLDGVDIDWEHPATDREKENFTLLMQDIREAVGNNKFLTFASTADPKYYDLAKLAEVVNFVNIMMYDVGKPPFHHSALHRSKMVNSISGDEAIDKHLKGGMPTSKVVLGMPFYGYRKGGDAIAYKNISGTASLANCSEEWDDLAKMPYLTDANNEVVFVYDNARSIGFKCEYLKELNLRGAMYWEYSQDDSQGTLRKVVWNGIKIN